MTTQTIEVEGLLKGWRAVAYRQPERGEFYLCRGNPIYCEASHNFDWLIIEKIQPSRISFDEITDGTQDIDADYYIKSKWWREVKETDIPLHKEEPKLSLSVGDVKRILSNTLCSEDIVNRMREFLKEN